MATRVDPQNESSRGSSEEGWIPQFSLSLSGSNILRQGIFLLVVLLVGFLAYDFYRYGITSPRYQIQLQVHGLNTIPEQKVRDVLKPKIGAKEDRRSLLQVSVVDVQQQLKEEIPRFSSVQVRKKYPDTLEVSVQERDPVALVARYDSDRNRTYYLPADNKGALFEPTPKETEQLPREVPVVKGLKDYEPGTRAYNKRWDRVRRVLRAVEDQFEEDILKWVEIIPGGYARIQIKRPKDLEVRLGLSNYERKVEKLYEMIQTSQFIQINKYIDLSDLDNIRVR